MPARPSHRLDIHLIPEDRSEAAVEAVSELWGTWVERGFLLNGGPGPRASALVEGGFAHARVDDPGAVVLYSNQVGGFQVRCPACGQGLAREFRVHEPTVCPGCSSGFRVDELDCRPAVALGRASLVLSDVESASVAEIPAGWHVVRRRVG